MQQNISNINVIIYKHFLTELLLLFPMNDNNIFVTKEKISNNELNSSYGYSINIGTNIYK